MNVNIQGDALYSIFLVASFIISTKFGTPCTFICLIFTFSFQSERGPLHGLPISVKECYVVGGYHPTAGLSIRLADPPQAEDGAFIKRIKQLGGIPFVLTNVPQTMDAFGCSNPIYGETRHPLDDARTPGGSSGGEACLLAMGGSPLGLGTDGGGSLRDPSQFCGLATLKATGGRIIRAGKFGGLKGYQVKYRVYQG